MIFWLWALGLMLLVLGFVALAFGYLKPVSADGMAVRPRWPLLLIGLLPLAAAIAVVVWMGSKPAAPITSSEPQMADAASDTNIDDLLDGLEAKLLAKPDDATGWGMLGTGRLQTGRYAEAAAAFARAAALQPDNAEFHSANGEALTLADNGRVGPAARQAFARARKLAPDDARARYYQAVARDSDGDTAGAIKEWISLLNDSPADAPFRADLGKLIEMRAAAAGIALDGQMKGPSAADMAVVQAMPAEDQQAMIANMVNGLDARLAAKPDDLDGWLRLVRARMVLGEREKALDALNRARKQFAGQPRALEAIEAEASRAGV